MSSEPFNPSNGPDERSAARMRRAGRMLTQLRADEWEEFLEDLAHQVTPSVNIYLRSLLAGLAFGLGFRFDQLAFVVAGALLSPSMGIVAGISLAAISGSPRFLLRLLGALLIAALIVLGAAGIAGGLGLPPGDGSLLVWTPTHLNLVDLALVLGASALLALRLGRGNGIDYLAGAALSYELLLPVAAVGVGIVRGNSELMADALLIAGMHTAWAVVAGMVTLALLGFRPLVGSGRSLAAAIAMIGVAAALSVAGLGASVVAAVPTPTPTATATATATATMTRTPPPSATPSPTVTDTATATATATPTATPTPPQALVLGTGGQGLIVRDAPNGQPVASLLENAQLAVIGEPVEEAGDTWLPVRTEDGTEGWVLLRFVATLTPEPSATP